VNHDSHTAASAPRSAFARIAGPLFSAADIRGVVAGFGDFFRFLWAHKKRMYAYTSILLLSVGVLGSGAWYNEWSLVRQVDRSSIVLVEVDSAPVDFTRPWARQDTFPASGTGSIIEGHRILTAAHVIDAAVKISVTRADGGDAFDASVHAVSHELDLAILTVDDDRFFRGSTPLELQELQHENDELVAYGFPGEQLEYALGWFSEVDRFTYSQSALDNLQYAVDILIKPGYSGGPLAWNGRMAGVVIEGDDSEETGYAVPAQVVRHFLKDIEDGSVDGTTALIGAWQSLENAQIRNHYGLNETQTGVIVKSVLRTHTGRPPVLPGDIILALDGCDVGNDGEVALEPNWRVSFEYLIDRMQVGDTVTVDLLRDGQRLTVSVPLIGAEKDRAHLVRNFGEEKPSYHVIGGFVFSPLTQDYLRELDSDSITMRTWIHQVWLSESLRTLDEVREEVVILARLLPDETTDGYNDCFAHVVTHVNGLAVGNMRDLVAGFEEGRRDYHRIRLQPDDKEIIISKAVLGDRQQAILDNYGIPADRSDDLAAAPSGEY